MHRRISLITVSLSILMLIGAIGFNLWLYRSELTIRVDPNDNAFQYALVDRTNTVWDWAEQTCLKDLSNAHCLMSYLIDHWVPNWAEGYNLPYYYSHAPQIIIVGSYRIFTELSQFLISNFKFLINFKFQILNFKLFEYYHFIIYLLLCFFPLSVFLSLRILKLPWLTAGIGALLATQISTDGLYGIDPSSFLWRGWGLSSQLFAVFWMPLALAYLLRITDYKLRITNFNPLSAIRYLPMSDFLLAVFFITVTTMGHMGLGLMLFLSLPVISFTKPILTFFHQGSFKTIWEEIKEAILKTFLLALPPLIILSYWIVPTVLDSLYHNISVWDPVWKFNSYGGKEVLTNLFNGYLFDWGRLPIYTFLVFVGLVSAAREKNCTDRFPSLVNQNNELKRDRKTHNTMGFNQSFASSGANNFFCGHQRFLQPLPFLFLFFLLLYFGSTTWGEIITLIPGMEEFHQHRFIVGVHLIGLFLAPIGVIYLINSIVFLLHKFLIFNFKFSIKISNFKFQILSLCLFISLSLYLCYLIYPQTLSYGTYNETLIAKANSVYETQQQDAELLIQTLKELLQKNPGRVYAGRGGTWGKTFRVAETPYFMYLSTYGLPTVLWLPQTWSNNSDTEQYFSEDIQGHYSLYNIRYIVTPSENNASESTTIPKPQPFWNLIKQTDHWKLYEVKSSAISHQISDSQLEKKLSESSSLNAESSSYITVGVSPSIVFSDKYAFRNVVRLWIQSPYPEKSIFPQLVISNQSSVIREATMYSERCKLNAEGCLPHFAMTDEATYQTPDGKTHSLFAEPPVYVNPIDNTILSNQSAIRYPLLNNLPIAILSQSSDTDMVFKATVQIATPSSIINPLPSTPTINAQSSSAPCPTCVVVLKQTYHPNWQVTVNGKKVKPISVFPSYVAVRLEQPGTYEIIFSYQPSPLKTILLALSIGCTLSICYLFLIKSKKS